ncbi:TolC family protein [Thiobacillus denitrificans]|uniref:TolC family protein n=1 Tax=Thiobacillus denitrificans TaxID=36861 RepID=UPI000377ED6F|nr:TolC family protein [Thiobacillus denitrificans]
MRFTLSVCLLALPLAAWAQASLTEAEAVRLGLARTELADLERGALQAAAADAIAAGLLPNPVLSYNRDSLNGSSDTTEQTWMLSQTFDVSGRRGLYREAADRRVAAVSAGNAGRRLDLAADIRRSFYETLLQQEIIRATETWTQRFVRVEGLVTKLARAGEASGYDRRRLERERRSTDARLAAERAEQARALARLVALTGLTYAPILRGELLPPSLPPLDGALARLDEHPDLQALGRRAEAADMEGRAAKRGAIPKITVGVGPKRVDNGASNESGIALTLAVPLPVFDRQQAGLQRAAAEALQARAEHSLARSRAEGELRGLHRQADGLRVAAADYRARAVAASADLLRIAEAAYQGGESSLLELLDAYRGALEAETTALELEQRAREARIAYDLLTGSSE